MLDYLALEIVDNMHVCQELGTERLSQHYSLRLGSFKVAQLNACIHIMSYPSSKNAPNLSSCILCRWRCTSANFESVLRLFAGEGHPYSGTLAQPTDKRQAFEAIT